MANLTSVGISSGVPNSGTGTVSTLDNLIGTAGAASAQVLTVQGVASMTPLKVDGSGVTQPVSAASLPLPAGAATQTTLASILTALGSPIQATGGAVNATLQASATTAIGKVDPNTIGNWGLQVSTQNSATPTNGELVLGQFNTTPTTITSGNVSPLQLDANGNLLVNIKAGAGSGGTALADAAAFTEGTTSITPIGGVFKTSHTALTTGQAGVLALTAAREAMCLGKVWDGTTTLPVLAASSGAPAATVPALPVSLRDMLPPGSAVSASSAPVVAASDQATLAVAFDTSQMLNGKSGVSLTPTKVKISVSTATTTTLVALVATKKIRILSMYLVCAAADTITFQSHTTTSNSDGGCSYAANGGISLPFNPLGWFDTTAGEALDMVTSASGQVSGQLTYVAV